MVRDPNTATFRRTAKASAVRYARAKKEYDRLLPNRNRFEGTESAVVAWKRAVVPRKP
jgi:hypothetical protein